MEAGQEFEERLRARLAAADHADTQAAEAVRLTEELAHVELPVTRAGARLGRDMGLDSHADDDVVRGHRFPAAAGAAPAAVLARQDRRAAADALVLPARPVRRAAASLAR